MESFTAGTRAGTGTFRCAACDYVITLSPGDLLPRCSGCGADSFVRASLFSGHTTAVDLPAVIDPDPEAWIAEVRDTVDGPGQFLAYDDGGEIQVFAITREWTRIGRSLAADIRFDDPTVSRRHALDRAPARRRARARRPLPQRRLRQRRAGRVEHLPTATRSSSAATGCGSSTYRRSVAWTPRQACARARARRSAGVVARPRRRAPRSLYSARWRRRSRSSPRRAAPARRRRCGRWRTSSDDSASRCSPSTSTRRATSPTTSTSIPTPTPTIGDVLTGRRRRPRRSTTT